MQNEETFHRFAIRKFCIHPSSFLSGLWCNSSISACDADGPGANPGFLTNTRSCGHEENLTAKRRASEP